MKRIIDIILAIYILLLTLPIILIVVLAIIFSMGLPVIFIQKRPGFHGKIFSLYKFRTMSNDTDKNGKQLSDDVRLTKTGDWIRKLSLDELPQLVNVIKGDMSLVGPRPLLVEYLPLYTSEQMRRHDVRPGITGWAQVNGRNTLDWDKRFELDLWYVDNQSLLLDLQIIYMTIMKVLRGTGVSEEGHVTMSKFTGSGENKNP